MRSPSFFVVTLSAALLFASTSCSQLPERIEMTELNPSAAAERAIQQYDTNGDGALSEDEYSKSPVLARARQQFDSDGDGSITQADIEARLQSWLDNEIALQVLPVQVMWRDRALSDATVRFVPEEFLGDAFRPAEGVTDSYGIANIVHAPEDRPDPEYPQGVRVGLYRVEVTKQEDGKQIIPTKYNEETTLGQEVASGAAGTGQMISFNLSP